MVGLVAYAPTAWFAVLREKGWRALSLSVEDGNRVAHLYRVAGFRTVVRNENADTMLLELQA